jgi:beta-barrel assembly-enhancing protease
MKALAYLLLIALPALNAQQNPDAAAGRGVNFYSIEKEAALGAQVAADFRRQNQILDDAQLNGYLARLGERLLKQIPETGFTFHFAAFVDDEKSGLHEARVLPGGYIFVPESLILASGEEAEFAGMIAHAVAHAAARHATRQASRGTVANFSSIPLIFLGGWAGHSTNQDAGMAIPLGFLQFQRASELEADHDALPMMARAGWDPEALVRYIEREQPEPDPRKPGTKARIFSSLPAREERLAALRKALEDLHPQGNSPSPEFAAVQADVRRLNAGRTPPEVPPTLRRPEK